MKKTKLALAITAATFASTSAFATNGTNMIAVGAQAAAIGGTGVAAFYGAENVIVNPGLIGKAQGTEFSFGGTLFMPTVTNDGANPSASAPTSAADTNVIPSVSLASRINDSMTFGIGMYGTSGMGVDYSGATSTPGVMSAQSNMQIMRFVPTLAINTSSFGLGISPIIQYGSLDINYVTDFSQAQDGSDMRGVGSGMASDLGFGYSFGGYFDLGKNLTLAAAYTSPIKMKYDGQLSTASQTFVNFGMLTNAFGDELEQPAELKLGAAFNMGAMTYTADYKQIAWGSATGYKDFGWEDQNVIAIGAKYTGKNFWAGIGYNTANNPIKEQQSIATGQAGPFDSETINFFNNLLFPATVESHMTIGGGYNLTKHVALDAAIVMAPEVKTSVGIMTSQGAATNTTTHSQMGYSFSVRYNF